jgi:SelR domain
MYTRLSFFRFGYRAVACVLFHCGQYDSGTGWPSFYAPVDPEHIIERVDPHDQATLPKILWRTEVLDRKSGTHLGHVFPGKHNVGIHFLLFRIVTCSVITSVARCYMPHTHKLFKCRRAFAVQLIELLSACAACACSHDCMTVHMSSRSHFVADYRCYSYRVCSHPKYIDGPKPTGKHYYC